MARHARLPKQRRYVLNRRGVIIHGYGLDWLGILIASLLLVFLAYLVLFRLTVLLVWIAIGTAAALWVTVISLIASDREENQTWLHKLLLWLDQSDYD